MKIKVRNYQKADFSRVNDFLVDIYRLDEKGRYANWLQPRWEYMHSHPATNEEDLKYIGIWEDEGEIVACVTQELGLGEAFFHVHPQYVGLKYEMFEYAEQHLTEQLDNGKRRLIVHINDFDEDLKSIARDKGYKKNDKEMEYYTITEFDLEKKKVPDYCVPEGFRVKSLKEENDLYKIDRCLWRGFNHTGEAPSTDEDIAGRKKMQSGPHFQEELNIVVEAPNGEFVAYGGMWFVEGNKVGYVEPVAVDPKYRKEGLGKAVVLEGIRRVKAMGAKKVYVESAIPFYLALGFEPIFKRIPWMKEY